MRRLHKQGRLSFATFPEIHFALYAEAHRVAQDLGWVLLSERGQKRKPNGAYIVNCLLCAALDQPAKERDEALRRGRAILERLGDSDKQIPFALAGSSPGPANPAVVDGRPIGASGDSADGYQDGPGKRHRIRRNRRAPPKH